MTTADFQAYFCKNEIEKETDETVDTDKETTGNDIAGERTNESDKSNSLSDYLNTRSFDKVVAAALDVCAPYMYDIDDLKSPSNGIKIKYDLKRVICAYWGMIVKKDPHSEKAKELQTLLELMSLEWGERITKLARAVMVRRNLTVKNELPAPADVEKLTKYIINQLNKTPLTEENYFRLAQLTQTRLLLYNKRRSGEIEGAKLANYAAKTRKLDDLDQSLIGDLTDVEKFLLSTQDLMKVRGKGNRPVPALIPLDAMKPLEFLSRRETRIKVGVGSENPYLFPNTGGKFTRSYGNLKKTCQEVHLEAPARITSVSMRKYTATLTQMLNLDKYQVDWVCRHLGHTKNVHKMYYRQMSGLIERTQLTKLLLLQDLNLTTKFKGRSLEEIDLKDIIFTNSTDEERAVSSEPTSSDDLSEVMNEAISNHERNDVMVDDIVFESDDDDDDEEASSSEEEEMKPVKKKITKKIQAPIKRQKFDEMEMSEIHKFFQTYLNMGITPKTKAIEAAKKESQKSNGKLWMRSNDKIVKKISNMNHKPKSA